MKRKPAFPAPQLALFDEPPPRIRVEAVLPKVTEEAAELASRVPPWIRLGTSSWTFPGWGGLIYDGSPSKEALIESGLRAYAAHPLFRTVGIDRSYYGPLSADDLRAYAGDLADTPSFRPVSKVWEELSTVVFPSHPRYGEKSGAVNPGFLDPARFLADVLAPFDEVFASYTGPFVVEIAPFPVARAPKLSAILGRIDAFLTALPAGVRVAFEVRNRELLVPDYFALLRRHGASHVMNFWTAMPTIGEQLALPGSLTADFVVSRLMLPPYTRYEAQKAAFEPFDRIVVPQPAMRADVVALMRAARAAGAKEAFVLVNNKAEGSSPLTVLALARLLAEDTTLTIR